MDSKKEMRLLTCWLLLLTMMYFVSWTYTYDTDTPAGSDAPSSIDDRIREAKDGVQERMNVDHYWPLTGSEVSDADAGEHRKILFHIPIATTPTVAASHGDLRIADVSSKAELFWTDEDENEIQITSAGDLYSSTGLGVAGNTALTGTLDVGGTLDVVGNIDPTTYETTNGGFLDEDDMASDAADKVASQQSIKKYVDDKFIWARVTSTGTLSRGNGVASAAKVTTGTYRITFSTAMANVTYARLATATDSTVARVATTTSATTTTCVVVIRRGDNNAKTDGSFSFQALY